MQAFVGERLVLAFRTQLVQHAQRLSLSYLDSKGSADSLYRINQDAAVIDKIMVEGIIPFVAAGITLAMMIVVMTRLDRSEEHTSELQSQSNLVCRLLLEKKKKQDVVKRRRKNHADGTDLTRELHLATVRKRR